MVIDWFTVGAQALNFLILVWLLKRFLYKPVLDALDAREKRIAGALAAAHAKQSEAEAEREELRRKNEEFDERREMLLSQAAQEAGAERRRLLTQARQAAEDLRSRQEEALRREHQSLRDEITHRTGEEVFAIARRALSDLAGASLEQRVIEVFLRRLQEPDGGAKESFAQVLKTTSEPVLARSAFELSPEQQTEIRQALRKTFSADVPVEFETAPRAISGLELTVRGRKIAWSLADYLASLERSVGQWLGNQARSPAESEKAARAESQTEGKEADSEEPK